MGVTSEAAPLYRLLAAVMTELQEAGEITPRDHTNILMCINWDRRKRRYTFERQDGYPRPPYGT